MEEPLIGVEDVLNGKYRYVEGQPVRRSYVDVERENMTDFEKAFDWFCKHCLEYINAETIGTCGAVAYNVNFKDMWETYKKAMEE